MKGERGGEEGGRVRGGKGRERCGFNERNTAFLERVGVGEKGKLR